MVMTYSDFIQTGIFLVALINLVYQIAKKEVTAGTLTSTAITSKHFIRADR